MSNFALSKLQSENSIYEVKDWYNNDSRFSQVKIYKKRNLFSRLWNWDETIAWDHGPEVASISLVVHDNFVKIDMLTIQGHNSDIKFDANSNETFLDKWSAKKMFVDLVQYAEVWSKKQGRSKIVMRNYNYDCYKHLTDLNVDVIE
jgi:hypothetical protein